MLHRSKQTNDSTSSLKESADYPGRRLMEHLHFASMQVDKKNFELFIEMKR